MKKIKVEYENCIIKELSENSLYFEQENNSLSIEAKIITDKSVRAYIKASNNNSAVTDELTPTDGMYNVEIADKYMSKGTLYVGFEIYDNNGYTERLEPIKIYIDSFVSLGKGSGDNVYVVTMQVDSVETLENDHDAYVENVGTKKDVRLKFGIPRGSQGIQGPKGEQGDKGDKGDTGEKGEKGENGYTPQKGIDYYTPQEKQAVVDELSENLGSIVDERTKSKADIITKVSETAKCFLINDSSEAEVSNIDAPDGCRVRIFGKNLANIEPFSAEGKGAGHVVKAFVLENIFHEKTQYTISVKAEPSNVTYNSAGNLLYTQITYTDGYTEYVGITDANYQSGRISITTLSGKTVARIANFNAQARWTGGTMAISEIQLEMGKTATPFEQYKPVQEVTTPYEQAPYTNYPTTMVISDSECSVTYKADTSNAFKNMNNEMEKLRQAIINLGGSI